MEAVVFGDYEWVFAQELASRLAPSVRAYAGSTDAGLSGESVTVRATSGDVFSVAIAEPVISIDVRAETESRVVELAGLAQAHAFALGREGIVRDDVVITGVRATGGIPYLNPDPQHPNLPRATFNAILVIKGHAA